MDVYELEIHNTGLLVRWTVVFNGARIATGTEFSVQMAIESGQHAIDRHCGKFFGIAA